MPAALLWVAEARRKAEVADLQAVHPVERGEPDVVETWQWKAYRSTGSAKR